uniref:CCDC144C-like coiled-coil domain-containing protein n=1 Tax=Otolemur garnettii TaxID=30611 RepID=H0XW38_OTOGA
QTISQEPDVKDCDTENVSIHWELSCMQTYAETWVQGGKLEEENGSEFNICEQYRGTWPEEEPLHDHSRGRANLTGIPSTLTSHILDCEEKDASGASACVVVPTVPKQIEPHLQHVFPCHSCSVSPECACQSSSQLSLSENKSFFENDNKPDTDNVFNTDEENFYSDTGNKKARESEVVTVEMKDGQEFNKQMIRNMKNPLCDKGNAKNYENVRPKCENVSSSPHSNRTSKVSLKEKLQQDVQKFKNEVSMLQAEFLAVEKEKIQLKNEVEEERKKQKSNEIKVSGILYDGGSDDSDNEPINTNLLEKQNEAKKKKPAKKTPKEKNKVEQNIHSMGDLDDLTGSSSIAPEDCELPHSDFMLLIEQLGKDCKDSVSLMKMRDEFVSHQRLLELTENHCEQLIAQIEKMENKADVLQKQLWKTEDINLQLEHLKVAREHELCTVRFTSKEEEEKRRNFSILCEQIREELRRKEEECRKEVEMKQQREQTLKKQNEEFWTMRTYLSEVLQKQNDTQRKLYGEHNSRLFQFQTILSKERNLKDFIKFHLSKYIHGQEKEKYLLHKNSMLQEEISKLRIEIATMKNQKQENEKKYLKDLEIAKEKNDDLAMSLKLNVDKLIKARSQYAGQFYVLEAENTILNHKLEEETHSKERLEREVASSCSRLSAVTRDLDESETSKRHLELALKRVRDEWFYSKGKMDLNVSNLIEESEILSQKLSNVESKIGSLETELHDTTADLIEKTLFVEGLYRELIQKYCQMNKMEQPYENEESKLNQCISKRESLEESLCQPLRESMLLCQQLDAAHSKADHKDLAVMNIQDQFQETVINLPTESEEQILLLGGKLQKLIKTFTYLKEIIYHCERDNAERETNELTEALETSSLQHHHVGAMNQVPPQELLSMETIQTRCLELQNINQKLKEAVVYLKNHMERNMIDCGQLEQYKWEIEARARQTIGEKLKEVILFLQTQAASQELRKDHVASVKSQLEVQIKDLESVLSKMTMSQDFSNIELEKYKIFCQVEIESKNFLSYKYNR